MFFLGPLCLAFNEPQAPFSRAVLRLGRKAPRKPLRTMRWTSSCGPLPLGRPEISRATNCGANCPLFDQLKHKLNAQTCVSLVSCQGSALHLFSTPGGIAHQPLDLLLDEAWGDGWQAFAAQEPNETPGTASADAHQVVLNMDINWVVN